MLEETEQVEEHSSAPDEGGEGNQGEGPAEGDDVGAVERGDVDPEDRETEVERAQEREERAGEG